MLLQTFKFASARDSFNRVTGEIDSFSSVSRKVDLLQQGIMESISPIQADHLKSMLESPAGHSVILIDCRPFLAYNAGHIATAHNVHFPPILKRRHCDSNIPLENIVRCSNSRQGLLDGCYDMVVVYDSSTQSLDRLDVITTQNPNNRHSIPSLNDILGQQVIAATKSIGRCFPNIYLVLQSLLDMLPWQVKKIHYLKGGFDSFSNTYQHLVKTQDFANSESNEKSDKQYQMSDQNLPSTMEVFDTIRCHSSKDKGDPVEILPWLYLGNSYHASQEDQLNKLGILALLNVAEIDTNLGNTMSSCFCHMNLPIADTATSDISCKFSQAIEFIENVHQSGGKVLVHCLAGISRSPAICMAYLMCTMDFSMDQAHDFIKRKRRIISPNLNFMQQLHEYERQLDEQKRSAAAASTSKLYHIQINISPSPSAESSPAGIISKAASHFISAKSSPLKLDAADINNQIVRSLSQKRPRPNSLTIHGPCSNKKSVPSTPCTKQATFTFDFPSVVSLASSPTVCHSPLVSPS